MNAIICLLFGHIPTENISYHTFYDGIQDKCYTRYDREEVCIRCQNVLRDLGSSIRQGTEQ